MLSEADRARFHSYLDPLGDEDCWEWRSTVQRNGYGRFHVGKRRYTASRLALELHIGRELTTDEEACHVCDNRLCCNPNHLFVGSRSDNMLDCSAKGRIHRPARRGELNTGAKLTEHLVNEIREMKGVKLQREVAADYGVSRQTVSAIQNGDRWSGAVPPEEAGDAQTTSQNPLPRSI